MSTAGDGRHNEVVATVSYTAESAVGDESSAEPIEASVEVIDDNVNNVGGDDVAQETVDAPSDSATDETVIHQPDVRAVEAPVVPTSPLPDVQQSPTMLEALDETTFDQPMIDSNVASSELAEEAMTVQQSPLVETATDQAMLPEEASNDVGDRVIDSLMDEESLYESHLEPSDTDEATTDAYMNDELVSPLDGDLTFAAPSLFEAFAVEAETDNARPQDESMPELSMLLPLEIAELIDREAPEQIFAAEEVDARAIASAQLSGEAAMQAAVQLQQATSAEECCDQVDAMRRHLTDLFAALGYQNAETMAWQLTERYQYDLKSLQQFIAALLRMLAPLETTSVFTGVTNAPAQHHWFGQRVVERVVHAGYALEAA